MNSGNNSASRLEIDRRTVGTGCPCLIVAEVAQAHDGSLGTAHAYIDAIAKAGADAVKFQTHIAAAESTAAEPFRVRFSPQDTTRFDYWRRLEFNAEQWRGLADHAHERDLIFLSTPFSPAAVALLETLEVPAWKVGSGELTNLPLLEQLAATGRPVLLSSGMASWKDLDDAVAIIRDAGAPLAILQCTTAYPCPAEKVGLNVLAEIRKRYGCPVGLSDHSGAIFAGLAAVALGANLLETHVVFSRDCFGPDVSASLTIAELAELVAGVRFIEQAIEHPVDKDGQAESLADLRVVFGKSIVAARDLVAGHQLTRDDLAFKKPGTGIPAARWSEVVGRRLKQRTAADTLFAEDDFA
jgi:N,N'-diacetyllegionaminate synthase